MSGRRAPKLSEAQKEALRLRKSQGATHEMLEAEFGCSHGTVVNALKQKPKPPAAPPPEAELAAVAEAAVAEDGGATVDVRALLRRQVLALEEMARSAKANENLSGYATIARVMNATAALAAKLEPPPVADPNEDPDMKAAAARAREKLSDLLKRAIEGEAA